MFDRNFLMYKN